MMTTWDEVKLRKDGAIQFSSDSSHLAVVLSLVLSLTAVAIIATNHPANSLLFDVAAFIVPIPIALYFDNRLFRFGVFTYVAAIALSLGAAILFGI
jgi:hypothetical protein